MYWHLSVQNAETKRNAVRSGRTFGAQVPHTWLPAVTSAVIGGYLKQVGYLYGKFEKGDEKAAKELFGMSVLRRFGFTEFLLRHYKRNA